MNLIKRLKELRQSRGISQQQLADVAMVSQQSINKYENHNIEPDITTMIRIADYFEVSVDYLIGRSNIREMADEISVSDLNQTERKLVAGFQKLNNIQKKCVLNIIDSYKS